MRISRAWRVTVVVVVGSLVACGAASAATSHWETWTNPDEGFRITIPQTWFLVPNTVSAVKSDITKLAKENAAQVAVVYDELIATRKAQQELVRFSFQAFAYSTLPVQTDVTVAIARTKAAYTSAKGLALVAQSEAKSDTAQGDKVEDARVVELPAGPAAYIDGTRPSPAGTVDFALYVIGHGTRLYQVSFSAGATSPDLAATSKTIATIAQSFAFT